MQCRNLLGFILVGTTDSEALFPSVHRAFVVVVVVDGDDEGAKLNVTRKGKIRITETHGEDHKEYRSRLLTRESDDLARAP